MSMLLNRLKKYWRGPAVTIVDNGNKIKLGSGDSEAEVVIHQPGILRKFWQSPSLTFGEAYMNGDLDIHGDIMALLKGFILTINNLRHSKLGQVTHQLQQSVPSISINQQQALKNAAHHYDIGNDFYKLWLDESLAYTCAFFLKTGDSLDQAQKQKFELVARKARLKPGQSIIDIGCGWGSFIFYAVENYGVKATGVVAAKEQGEFILAEAKKRGLADKITILIDDWRASGLHLNSNKPYDRVISIGIMEHVGEKNYAQFLQKYQDLLADDGIAFIHTIGRLTPAKPDPWSIKYIFPGGFLPTIGQITKVAGEHDFVVTDVQNLWQHYAQTLEYWHKNFMAHESEVRQMFDERFIRMWSLYLLGSEAAFRYGGLQLWQVTMLKNKQVKWPLNREVWN